MGLFTLRLFHFTQAADLISSKWLNLVILIVFTLSKMIRKVYITQGQIFHHDYWLLCWFGFDLFILVSSWL